MLKYSMSVTLLTEHHLEFLSSKGGCTGSSESILVKCHIFGNQVSRLILFLLWITSTLASQVNSNISPYQRVGQNIINGVDVVDLGIHNTFSCERYTYFMN